MRHLQLVLSVVPTKVQFKVGILLFLGAITLCLTFNFLSDSLIGKALLFSLAGVLFYGVWCFWPKWQWGTQNRRLGSDPKLGFHLSFDDGPSPELTPALLALLKAHGVKASFFVLVSKAKEHPSMISQMIRDGHTVGLHGWDHRKPFFSSMEEVKAHLGMAKAELEKLTGVPVSFYRPSHGWKNIALLKAVHALDLSFCFWDAGVWDTDNPEGSVLRKRLSTVMGLARQTPEPPLTLLLHDGLGDLQGSPPHAKVLLEGVETLIR